MGISRCPVCDEFYDNDEECSFCLEKAQKKELEADCDPDTLPVGEDGTA